MPILIDNPAGLQNLIPELLASDRYGIDTEFHGERSYWPRLALVQISWPGEVALIDPLAVDVAPLAQVLNGNGLCIMHAGAQDLAILERACGTIPNRLFDTQLAAGFVGLGTPSLSSLCDRMLRVRLSKGDQLADWTRRPMTESQLEYAASDVAHLLALHDTLLHELDARGRTQWAIDECELMRTRPRGRPEPENAWWKLKGSRSLRGKARGVAQCVAAWRERTAQSLDRPPRQILPDLALLSIAQRPPHDARELAQVRGIERRALSGDAPEQILAAIAQGDALRKEDLSLPDDDPSEGVPGPVAVLLTTWIAQLADDSGIEPSLLATRADLRALLSGNPDARLAHGWRNAFVAEPVRKLMSGDASVAVASTGDRLVLREP
ncbi:MAG: ribonuclease D [Acidimicrobiia bacterium]